MTSETIRIRPMSPEAFAAFGDIIAPRAKPDKMINQGLCARHHDLAQLDFTDGRAGISLFQAELRSLPLRLDMLERHPDGSQAFLPMSPDPFLVIVAADHGGEPDTPQAFLTSGGTGVNYHRGTWHGVLTPMSGPGLFAVVDRIGPGPNLEEFYLSSPVTIDA